MGVIKFVWVASLPVSPKNQSGLLVAVERNCCLAFNKSAAFGVLSKNLVAEEEVQPEVVGEAGVDGAHINNGLGGKVGAIHRLVDRPHNEENLLVRDTLHLELGYQRSRIAPINKRVYFGHPFFALSA